MQLAAYLAASPQHEMPPAVAHKTKQHILDTLAAMVSGSRLKAGRLALAYVEGIGGRAEATLAGSGLLVPAVHAALANGMAAHADETNDSHLVGRFHPGCAIVPAALAVAEAAGRSGAELIGAVALGYDVGARVNIALGLHSPEASRHSSHSLGALFGAAAASAALLRLDAVRAGHVMAFAVQQASGVPCWTRDPEHVEKAFDFGGMGARNGVAAATMVAAGFSGVPDSFEGAHNLFSAFGGDGADPARLVEGLGERFEINAASIKKWCVGSPIQAPLDAITALIAEHRLGAGEVARIVVHMPDDRLHIVSDRAMPDVCLQHLLALALVDGGVTFETVHDHARMADPAVLAVRRRVEAVPSRDLTLARPARGAIVEVETGDGRRLRHHACAARRTTR